MRTGWGVPSGEKEASLLSAAPLGSEAKWKVRLYPFLASVVQHMKMAMNCTRGESDWTREKHVFPEGDQTLEHASYQGGWCPMKSVFKGHLSNALKICFKSWLAPKWSGSWIWSLKVLNYSFFFLFLSCSCTKVIMLTACTEFPANR